MRAALIEQTEQLRDRISKTAREAERRLVHLGKEAGRMKAAIAEAVDDNMITARRAVKHGYRVTEDFVDDAAHRIKRDPLPAVSIAFAVGVVVGWVLPHRMNR